MKTYLSILLVLMMALVSCHKQESETKCPTCEFPFLTGNVYQPYIANHGQSYNYNGQCWRYLGATRNPPAPQPPLPGTNPSYWQPCGIPPDCNTLYSTTPDWTFRIYYWGEKVKHNGKIFICMDQGNSEPEAPDDDIWAVMCK